MTSTDSNSRTSALLVIDVQNSNVEDAWKRDEIVARIRTLIDNAKAAGTPVIWIQHEEGKPFTPGTEGWQIVEEIRPDEGETVIPKHYLDSFADTPLRKHLDDLGVGHLVICGAATDACVRTTTARAMVEGYDTTLVGDAHTTDEGPWDLELPDGRTVPVGAETMVAYTNFFVADTAYPGIKNEVVNHDQVEFNA